MEISHFDEFLELARQLSFTEASKRLNMTQSALSKHISGLEREYGIALFKRNRQKVELTEAGRALYAYSLTISQNYHDSLIDLASIKKQPPIRVSGILLNQEIVGLVSEALKIAEEESGEMDSITPVVSSQYSNILESGEADIYLSAHSPDTEVDPSIKVEILYYDRFIAIVSNQHQRLARRTEVSLSELEDEVFLQLISDYSDSAWQCIEYACSKAGFNPKRKPRLIQSTLEYATIPLGDSIYIVPEATLSTSSIGQNDRLIGLKVTDEFAAFPIGVAYLKDKERDVMGFVDHLREAVERLFGSPI